MRRKLWAAVIAKGLRDKRKGSQGVSREDRVELAERVFTVASDDEPDQGFNCVPSWGSVQHAGGWWFTSNEGDRNPRRGHDLLHHHSNFALPTSHQQVLLFCFSFRKAAVCVASASRVQNSQAPDTQVACPLFAADKSRRRIASAAR